jgi:hypothetical protein
LLASVAFAQSAPEKPKTAAEQFKNIQVLKDVPANEVFPTMGFIAGSLGVGCDHCHVNPFAADEKPAKKRAREMMKMVQQINAQFFPDMTNRVTCATCHNGGTSPAKAPAVADAAWLKQYLAASSGKPAAPAALPDAQQLIDRYRAAIGGKNLERIVTRYYKGTATTYNGSEAHAFDQVVYLEGDQVRVDVSSKQGLQTSIYNGRRGWVLSPKESHPMNDEELGGLRGRVLRVLQLDYLPRFTQAVTKRAEELRGHQCWVVELNGEQNRVETVWFDQQNGLLVQRRGLVPTAFGNAPEETWFEDYKDFAGVKLPMTVITAGVNNGIVRQFEVIELNLPIDPSKFAPPSQSVGSGQ